MGLQFNSLRIQFQQSKCIPGAWNTSISAEITTEVFSTVFLNLVILWEGSNCSAFFLKFLFPELPGYVTISDAKNETFSSLQGSTEMPEIRLTFLPPP